MFQNLLHKNDRTLNEPEAFAHFYEQAHLNVFCYCMVLCSGNQPEAEDVTAEAFLRAWEKRSQFSGETQAALGWAITIARNILIDRRRSETAHPDEQLEDETLEDDPQNLETMLIAEEQMQQVLDAVQTLPFRQRELFTLRYVLGWRVNAIAAHLNMPENTISVTLRRALARLKLQLLTQDAHDGRAV